MATYVQQRRLFHIKQERKRLYYLCGPERVLVETIVDDVREWVNPADIDYTYMYASSSKEREIWAALNQYPADPKSRRLVLIRDVEKLKQWSHLTQWLESRHIPKVTAVLVDNRPEVDTGTDHMKRVIASARYVSCTPPNPADAAEFLNTLTPTSDEGAAILLARTGGDLRRARDAALKAAALGLEMTPKVAEKLAERRPGEQFEDALIRLHKAQAIAAAQEVPLDDLSRTIGALDYRLEQIARLARYLRQQREIRDIIRASGIPPFLIKEMLDYVKHYDRGSIRARMAVLALADSRLARGHRDGLLELLTVAW